MSKEVKLPEDFQKAVESSIEKLCDTQAKCDYAADCINDKRMSLGEKGVKSKKSFSDEDEPKY